MPKFLSVTPKEGETNDQFAERLAAEAAEHFGSGAEAGTDESADIAEFTPPEMGEEPTPEAAEPAAEEDVTT